MTRLSAVNRWLRRSRPRPHARRRLFCFPYAGGAASVYRTWSEELPEAIEVCAVQLPGREERISEAPFVDLAPLIAALLPALLPTLTLPFAFFGHSLGALIAFELASALRRAGHPLPFHLFVAAHPAPHRPHDDTPIHDLPEPEFVAELRRLNGTPDALLQQPELLALLLPALRADFAIYERYQYTPEAPLPCLISAFGGLRDLEVSRDDLAAWRDQTSGPFTLRMFPGDHFFPYSDRALLLRTIARELALSSTG
jgi:medium-chain acyl-[acyl-carrier-protein] hydrolase